MKKKRKKYQTVQPTPELAPEPEKVIPITAGRVQVGDMVKRKPITFSDSDKKDAGLMVGRVVWIHPWAGSMWLSLARGGGPSERALWG